jgi:cell division protein FtsL
MTPPTLTAPPPAPAAAGGQPGMRRAPAPQLPRRRSVPARPVPRGAPRRRVLARRLGRVGMRVGDARLLDRLVRGRAWIAIVAVALLGLVFTQVSLLRLNAGISRAVTAADTLDRQNAAMRAEISSLESGERIQAVAARLGMVMPAAGSVHFLDARDASGARAASAIRPPQAPTTTITITPPVATPPAPTTTTPTVTAQPTAAPAATAAPTGQGG